MSDHVSVRVENGVGRITLNRPEALHSLTMSMFQTIMDTVTRWSSDASVHLVMVDHADGSRGFCSGGDISLFLNSGNGDPAPARALFRVEYGLNVAISRFPKPYLGVIDGVTMGGGAGITIHGSHRLATENTVFAMPETAIGLFPDIGAGYFLSRMPGQIGTWLGLTGARLRGTDTAAIGVATHYLNSQKIAQLKSAIAGTDFSSDAMGKLDRLICEFAEPVPPPGYQQYRAVIDRCFAPETVEAIIAALQREPSDWARQQVESLQTKSPTSLKLALRLIRQGAGCRTLAEEMKTEFRIVWRRVDDQDLAQGVRAVVVDKNRKPSWSPGTLERVSDAMVDRYFAPLGENELSV